MFIGICGAICAGKKTVAQYLVDHHGFQRLYLLPRRAEDNDGDLDLDLDRDHHPTFFTTAESLLDHVTVNWQSRWVTTDVRDEPTLDLFIRRPFFVLISVDAPVTARWRRYQQQWRQRSGDGGGDNHALPSHSQAPSASPPPPPSDMSMSTLEEFVARSDSHLYDPVVGLLPLVTRATVRLLNTSPTLAHLYATLGNLALTSPERLRPSWDAYFMALASLAARRSNCMRRRVGAVLVGRGRRVLSTGYNGTPRGMRNCADGGCGRCNGAGAGSGSGSGSGIGLATCLCIHAEENALLEAGRERIREGSVLYCDTCPCLTCSIKICQVGIGEVVYNQGYSMDTETAAVFREAGVGLRQFSPPPDGLIHLEKHDILHSR